MKTAWIEILFCILKNNSNGSYVTVWKYKFSLSMTHLVVDQEVR